MFVEEHKNSNNSPYKFNAKELDEETGNYYYGARYYDPKWSVWLSVDPMAEKYPGWSPYNYTLNNPVKYVDPDGRAPQDIFQINHKGEITQISAVGEDVVVLVDKKGNEIGNRTKIGNDAALLKGGNGEQVLIINDQSKAKTAFKEISDNVNKEFAKIDYNDSADNVDKSALITNGKRSTVAGDDLGIAIDKKNVGTVTSIEHNHPGGNPPSGYNPETGEILSTTAPIGDAKGAVNYPKNNKGDAITRKVYIPETGKAYQYDNNKFNEPEDY